MAISSKNNHIQVDPEYELFEAMEDQLRESIDSAIMERFKNIYIRKTQNGNIKH